MNLSRAKKQPSTIIFMCFSCFFIFVCTFLQSDNPLESDKGRYIDNNSNHDENYCRSISSPGFDDNTSNSTLSAASPDPAYGSSYTSNGSQRERIQTTTLTTNFSRVSSVESWAERHHSSLAPQLKPKPRLTPKIAENLANYETKLTHEISTDQDERNANVNAVDLPKIDISSRRELFEKEQKAQFNRSIETKKPIVLAENAEPTASIKERLSHLEKRDGDAKEMATNKANRMSGDFSSVRDRFAHEQFVNVEVKAPKIDVPVVPLKERLLTLESSAVTETMTPHTAQLDNRTKKMSEPKMIDLNEFNERIKLTADNGIGDANLVSFSHKHQPKEDDDSGIHSDDLQSSLASQQSQPHQIEEVSIETVSVGSPVSPVSPTKTSRKPEVLPRRQITPDLVKVTPKVNIEDDLLQSNDEIDDEADNSVSPSKANSALTKNIVNLTIKSILVDSNDICKASTSSSATTTSSSSTSLVMEQKSIESAADATLIVENNNNSHKIIDNCNQIVDVEHKLTDIISKTIVNDVAPNNANELTNGADKITPLTEMERPISLAIEPIVKLATENQSPSKANANFINDLHQSKLPQPNESMQSKNERIKCQIVGVLEKTRISPATSPQKSPTMDPPSISPATNSPSPTKSPSKTKNIFDFIKRNLLNESNAAVPAAAGEQESNEMQMDQDSSKFYVSLSETESQFKASSLGETHSNSNEINQLLDEELEKLSDKAN